MTSGIELATWVLAGFTGILAIATIIYAYFTYQTGKIIKAATKSLESIADYLDSTSDKLEDIVGHIDETTEHLERLVSTLDDIRIDMMLKD